MACCYRNLQQREWAPKMFFMAVALGCFSFAARGEKPECPQARFTDSAPSEYLAMRDPTPIAEGSVAQGERLYKGLDGSINCALCHGDKGDGMGPLAKQYDPRPRNFKCAKTVNDVPDGQLFWIIRYGSPGTSMPPNPRLDDKKIWRLVHFLRHLAH